MYRRLALLYARMVRISDAERHLAAAAQAFDRPDPEVWKMLSDARMAVAVARGRAER